MKFKGIAKGKARENLPEYPIQISIVYSVPQQFSNLLQVLLLLVPNNVCFS